MRLRRASHEAGYRPESDHGSIKPAQGQAVGEETEKERARGKSVTEPGAFDIIIGDQIATIQYLP